MKWPLQAWRVQSHPSIRRHLQMKLLVLLSLCATHLVHGSLLQQHFPAHKKNSTADFAAVVTATVNGATNQSLVGGLSSEQKKSKVADALTTVKEATGALIQTKLNVTKKTSANTLATMAIAMEAAKLLNEACELGVSGKKATFDGIINDAFDAMASPDLVIPTMPGNNKWNDGVTVSSIEAPNHFRAYRMSKSDPEDNVISVVLRENEHCAASELCKQEAGVHVTLAAMAQNKGTEGIGIRMRTQTDPYTDITAVIYKTSTFVSASTDVGRRLSPGSGAMLGGRTMTSSKSGHWWMSCASCLAIASAIRHVLTEDCGWKACLEACTAADVEDGARPFFVCRTLFI